MKQLRREPPRHKGIYTGRHQKIRSLHRGTRSEATQPLPITKATQRCTRTEGIYTEPPEQKEPTQRTTRSNLHRDAPEQKEPTQSTRRNLHREAPEPKEFTQ